ncbi:YciI family protein [Aliiroseovarius sp. YM-037]|uniref:YciI family protein n=1 Tax=Aliiroseovarius sp. YM-037 TaxID=3341728 RepID=UPI003A810687
MHFTFMIYGEEGAYDRLPEEVRETFMEGHRALQRALDERGPFATARLMPTSHAVTLKPVAEIDSPPLVVDGPFAETKERFLGLYIAEFADIDEAIKYASYLSSPYAKIEVRPVNWAGGMFASEES